MATLEELLAERDRRSAATPADQPAATPAPAPPALPEGYELIGTFADGGRVFRSPSGQLGAVSAGGSTTDPSTVARIMSGDSFAAVMQDTLDAERIAANPIASRAQEVVRGVPFVGSWTDEAVGVFAPQAADNMRLASEAMARQNPTETLGLNIGGGILGAIPMALAGAASLPSTIGRRMATGGLLGGLEGAIWGAGEGDPGARADSAVDTGLLGAGIGATVPVVGGAITRGVNDLLRHRAVRAAAAAAPSMDQLRAQAGAIYDAADQVTGIPRGSFVPAAQGMVDQATRSGMDPMLTPSASRVASNIEEVATQPYPDMAWRELDILRRQAAIPAGDVTNRTQSAIGSQIIEGLDNFVETVNPALAEQLTAARSMWSRLRRSEVIEAAIQRAGDQASGLENGLRIQFRHILNSPKLIRGFTPDEVEAMRAVVQGTPFGNLLRLVGSFGAPMDGGRNALGLLLGSGAGAAAGTGAMGPAGGLLGAIGLPMLATGARAGSAATTERAARLVQDAIAGGGVSNVPRIGNEGRGLLEMAIQGATRPLGGLLPPF